MNWWVRWEDDDGEIVDDGPFASKEQAAQHCAEWHECVARLILNDDDRASSPV